MRTPRWAKWLAARHIGVTGTGGADLLAACTGQDFRALAVVAAALDLYSVADEAARECVLGVVAIAACTMQPKIVPLARELAGYYLGEPACRGVWDLVCVQGRALPWDPVVRGMFGGSGCLTCEGSGYVPHGRVPCPTCRKERAP